MHVCTSDHPTKIGPKHDHRSQSIKGPSMLVQAHGTKMKSRRIGYVTVIQI
jgi:hypothetical protein